MSTQPQPDLPPDDAPVHDSVLVYRLIPTWWCDVVDGQWEFQSGAFDNATPETEGESPDDMSVVLGDTLALLERRAEEIPVDTAWADEQWGVAQLEVAFLRGQEGQEILRTPQPDEPAHGDARGKKSQKRRRRMKAHATWVVRPAAVPA